MKFLGNLIWLIFGGLAVAIEYFTASIALCLTIIGIPFALQTIKLGVLAIWPFGSRVSANPQSSGCLSALMNVIWFFVGGIWIFLTHLFFGILLCITIVGIPWGIQHFKLTKLALLPFGREIS